MNLVDRYNSNSIYAYRMHLFSLLLDLLAFIYLIHNKLLQYILYN